MPSLHNTLKYITARLKAESGLAAGADHLGMRGASREGALHRFLTAYLPKNVVVLAGTIENSAGGRSRQQDCILLDHQVAFPLLDLDQSNAIYPVESVLGTVEVKSNTKRDTVREAIDNVESVKRLAPPESGWTPFGGVFCFGSSTSVETLARSVHELSLQREAGLRPDVLLVLDGPVLFWGDVEDGSPVMTSPLDSETLICVEAADDTLWIFMLAIHEQLRRARPPAPDFLSYIGSETPLAFRTVTRS